MDKLQFVYVGEMKPAVRGRWIDYPECLGYDGAYSDVHIVCSNCKSVWSIIDNDTERFDFCPACGAKMDGRRTEGWRMSLQNERVLGMGGEGVSEERVCDTYSHYDPMEGICSLSGEYEHGYADACKWWEDLGVAA